MEDSKAIHTFKKKGGGGGRGGVGGERIIFSSQVSIIFNTNSLQSRVVGVWSLRHKLATSRSQVSHKPATSRSQVSQKLATSRSQVGNKSVTSHSQAGNRTVTSTVAVSKRLSPTVTQDRRYAFRTFAAKPTNIGRM